MIIVILKFHLKYKEPFHHPLINWLLQIIQEELIFLKTKDLIYISDQNVFT